MGGQRFLFDANVLIDFAEVDRRLFGLCARALGECAAVADVVAGEVSSIDPGDLSRAGFALLEPTLEQLARSRAPPARLSSRDQLCLLLALDQDWILVTNDQALRRASERQGVSVRWGLEIVLGLVSKGAVSPRRARELARAMRERSPGHLTRDILERFERLLRQESAG
ncbi:MAG TPA: hypothetical protein VNB06_19270 [Thermoanaerobaculia bacterium]|nr:hypothetical protein [Thermoanaerobaculia bacterium]